MTRMMMAMFVASSQMTSLVTHEGPDWPCIHHNTSVRSRGCRHRVLEFVSYRQVYLKNHYKHVCVFCLPIGKVQCHHFSFLLLPLKKPVVVYIKNKPLSFSDVEDPLTCC